MEGVRTPPAVIAGATVGAFVGGALVVAAIAVLLRQGHRPIVAPLAAAVPVLDPPPPSAPALFTSPMVGVPTPSAPPGDLTKQASDDLRDQEDPVAEDP